MRTGALLHINTHKHKHKHTYTYTYTLYTQQQLRLKNDYNGKYLRINKNHQTGGYYFDVAGGANPNANPNDTSTLFKYHIIKANDNQCKLESVQFPGIFLGAKRKNGEILFGNGGNGDFCILTFYQNGQTKNQMPEFMQR